MCVPWLLVVTFFRRLRTNRAWLQTAGTYCIHFTRIKSIESTYLARGRLLLRTRSSTLGCPEIFSPVYKDLMQALEAPDFPMLHIHDSRDFFVWAERINRLWSRAKPLLKREHLTSFFFYTLPSRD